MPSAHWSPVLRYLRRIAAPNQVGQTSDRVLLDRFVRTRDEEAFAALVKATPPWSWRFAGAFSQTSILRKTYFKRLSWYWFRKPDQSQSRIASGHGFMELLIARPYKREARRLHGVGMSAKLQQSKRRIQTPT